MEEQCKSIVIGTAGHIDHGKTRLVRALTGVDTDRLPEEKRRGITIDLGFAAMKAHAPDGAPLQISFVDVPGHKLFVRNMLAGTGCVDAVMLVISAEEGVKPQTEEHMAICGFLGIRRGFAVITKADAVGSEHLGEVCVDVRRYLAETFLGSSRILVASALSGEGMKDVRRELVSLAAGTANRSRDRLPRLPIDRAFVMRGFGTVVTGTLLSGDLQTEEMVRVQPGDQAARIRGLHIHSAPRQQAQSGARVAVNLSGVDVADVARGHTLVQPDTLAAVDVIDVEACLLAEAKALKHRSRVRFHAFTADTLANVSLFEGGAIQPGGNGLLRLRLNKAIVLLPGDRFVLRQCSPPVTIGGGRVLDAHPLLNLRKAESLARLREMKNASQEQQLLHRVMRRGTAGLSLRALSAETGLTVEAIRRMTEAMLVSRELVLPSRDLLLARRCFDEAMTLVAHGLENAATRDGGRGAGLKRAELKSFAGLSIEVFDLVLERLSRERKLRLQGEFVLPFGSGANRSQATQAQMARIASVYETAGLAAPLTSEIASKTGLTDSEVRNAITALLQQKALVKMGSDTLFIHRSALEHLKARMLDLRGQTIDVGSFKAFTGLSRKYAIPLLEYLDRERVTRKQGEIRSVL